VAAFGLNEPVFHIDEQKRGARRIIFHIPPPDA
jgi:hypothetical protein